MPDQLTVLISVSGKHAGKNFSRGKDGGIRNRSYGNEKCFRVHITEVNGIAELGRALATIASNQFAFVIRGAPLPGINLKRARRLLRPDKKSGDPATFKEVPRYWLLVDVDHIVCPAAIDPKSDPTGAVEYVLGLLPAELHVATCWWQWSSSQSVYDNETLSLHLWFWLDVPLTGDALTRWAIAANDAAGCKLIDPATFRTIQALYTAAPTFSAPLADPLSQRSGTRHGLDDAVALLIPPPASPRQRDQPGTGGYEPGLGVAAILATIGGAKGFREPIVSAIASYIATYGSAADPEPIKKAIRAAVNKADPGSHPSETIERYKSDSHLDEIISWVKDRHGDRPPKGFMPEPPDEDPELPSPEDLGPPAPVVRPIVRVIGGELPAVIDRAEALLVDADPGIFAFGDQVVRPAIRPIRVADKKKTTGLRLVPIAAAHMIEKFTRSIDFQKYNKKEKSWLSIDCPRPAAAAYL